LKHFKNIGVRPIEMEHEETGEKITGALLTVIFSDTVIKPPATKLEELPLHTAIPQGITAEQMADVFEAYAQAIRDQVIDEPVLKLAVDNSEQING